MGRERKGRASDERSDRPTAALPRDDRRPEPHLTSRHVERRQVPRREAQQNRAGRPGHEHALRLRLHDEDAALALRRPHGERDERRGGDAAVPSHPQRQHAPQPRHQSVYDVYSLHPVVTQPFKSTIHPPVCAATPQFSLWVKMQLWAYSFAPSATVINASGAPCRVATKCTLFTSKAPLPLSSHSPRTTTPFPPSMRTA